MKKLRAESIGHSPDRRQRILKSEVGMWKSDDPKKVSGVRFQVSGNRKNTTEVGRSRQRAESIALGVKTEDRVGSGN